MARYDCIIVGGGAAGLAAAVLLARRATALGQRRRVLLCEKGPRVGKKLLATGNGTCNLTNTEATASHYYGDRNLANSVLKAFTYTDAIDFFRSIGVDVAVREDGKVYPYSAQAAAVLDALRLQATATGVDIRCDCAVTALRPVKGGWQVTAREETLSTATVLVAVGGAAAPALGGSAESYRLLTALDYEKTPLFPSIVQVRTATDFVRAVKGVRLDATVSFCLEGKTVATSTGELLFADYGLSGPVVMAISRCVGDWERQKRGAMTAVVDLLPSWDETALTERLKERAALPGRTLEDLFTGLLHKRLGQTVLRVAGIGPLTRETATLTEAEARLAAATAKGWTLSVTGTQGFGGAQVTAGGIDTAAFDPATLMSRRHPGLYAAGEVLNVDGDCGGYNLQFAWSSGAVVARAIAADWEGQTCYR